MPRPCRTCRSRKKACNGSRPECGTCRKSGRVCEGYEPLVRGVFVNLDAGSMNVRMKTHIGVAIDLAREEKPRAKNESEYGAEYDDGVVIPSSAAIHTLDLSASDFQAHFQTLMARFRVDYARTSSCWSEDVTNMGLRSRVLDMALISLMTIRLSFTTQRDQYLVFSLSTYNTGLQSFRRLLKTSAPDCSPQLVVISLVFTLFEASQQQPTRIYSSGWAGHLTGALALLQRQGPARFQEGGFHTAFKKLREMAVLLALSNKETTFLTQPEWMEVPWKVVGKTRRDFLLDIAVHATTVHALLYTDPTLESYRHISSRYRKLRDDLLQWRQAWLASEAPTLPIKCCCAPLHACTCLPSPAHHTTNEFSYLAAEYTSILLLLTHIAHHLPHYITYKTPPVTTACLATQITSLRTNLEAILTLPSFGRALSDLPGLTEGRCRALFPIWVLSETVPVIPVDKEVQWWDGLYARANYGIA
ncbi:hypothetical protein BJX70DRAFT_202629 [Aspergillus crustosus]